MGRFIAFLMLAMIVIIAGIATITSPMFSVFTSATGGPYGGSGAAPGIGLIVVVGFTVVMILGVYQAIFGGSNQPQQYQGPTQPRGNGGEKRERGSVGRTGSTESTGSTKTGGSDVDDEFQDILNQIDDEIEDDWR